MLQIQFHEGGIADIDGHPDQCPICHSKISPIMKYGRTGTFHYRAQAQVVYVCPNVRCNEFFIAYFELRQYQPQVREISPAFCAIYEEAHKAEQFGLIEICGVGYRKSLEFLIKDYLIRKRPADKATIETIMLGPCIETTSQTRE
jgi:hypothetical protein